MPFDDEQILQDYIARLLTLQDQREDWIDAADLQAAARDLGLSDADLRRAEELAESHRQRGRNFSRHDAWDEAIAEFRQAMALDPFDVPLLHEMAVAHASRFEEAGAPEDRERAASYARRCIELEPDFQPAYELLAALKQAPAVAHTPSSGAARWVLAAVAVLLVMVGGAVFALLSLGPSPPAPNPVPAPNPAPAPNAANPAPPGIASGEVELPVRLQEADGLSVEVQRSLLKAYDAAFSYTLHATLRNDAQELHLLRLRMDLLDEAGAVLASEYVDVVSDYQPPLRPNDRQPIAALIYQKQAAPSATAVRLAVDRLERLPAPSSYGTPVTRVVRWTVPQPPGISVAVSERESRLSDGFSGPMHFLTLAVRNDGERALRRLRLEVTWYDAEGKVLTTEEALAVPGSGPVLMPGTTWVERVIGELDQTSGPPYARYAVAVVEIE